MSTFSYEIFQIINKLEIGRKWEEYIESSSDLSSIFNKIDDSDGIVEQHEIQMLKIWAERLKNYTGSLNIKDLLNNNQLKIDDNFKLVYNEFEKLNPAEIITADNFLLENISMEGFNELRNKNKNQNADTQKLIESLAEYNFDDTYRYEVESNKLFTFIYDKNDILIARLNNNAQTLLIYDQDGFKEKQINLNNNTVTPLRSRTTSTPASADKRIDAFISASFGTSENLMISVIKLTGEDIYKLSQKDQNDENSLYKAIERIIENRNITPQERETIITIIIDKYIEFAKSNGTYTEDLEARLKDNLKYEKNKIGYMSAEFINRDLKRLKTRFQYRNQNNSDSANGAIDNNFKQGRLGDCWFLATIKSITLNPKLKKILNSQIVQNSDGSITVELKGVGKKYTISKAELEGAKEYSSGDLDVRALEIAVDRYLMETNQRGLFRDKGRTDIEGDYTETALSILFDSKDYKNNYTKIKDCDDDTFNEILRKLQEGKNICCTVFTAYEEDYADIKAIGANNTSQALSGPHMYTVIGADDSFVYIANPWDTSLTFKVTIDEFRKAFYGISIFE